MPSPTVAVLAYPGMSAFETGMVTEVFGLPRPELDVSWYRLAICAELPAPLLLVGGAHLTTPHGLDAFARAQTVIVPGVPDVHADPSPELVAALRLAHRRGAPAGASLSRPPAPAAGRPPPRPPPPPPRAAPPPAPPPEPPVH